MKKITIISIISLLSSLFSYSQTLVFNENFNGGSIPSEWEVSHAQGSEDFTFGSGDMPGTESDFSTNAAIFNDDAAGSGEHNVVYLASPYFDLTDYGLTVFKFDYALNVIEGNGEYLQAKISDGTNYFTLVTYDSDTSPTTSSTFDIKSIGLNHGIDISHIQVYFKYDDNNSWGWGCGIDNFSIVGWNPPVNDACDNAVNIGYFYYSPYSTTLDASEATNNDGFITACGSGMNDGVWYTFTAVHTGEVTVNVNPTGWDPEIGVYTGSCGSFTCVDNIDDGGNGTTETLTFPIDIGTTYYINVGHYSSAVDNSEGLFNMNISYNCGGSAPSNDACGTAWNMSLVFTEPYTNAEDATCASGGTIDVCGSGMNDGVWFKFLAPDKGDIEITIDPDDSWDPEIGIYSGTCGDLTCVDSEDNWGTGHSETISVYVNTGTQYYVNVGNYDSLGDYLEGYFTINAHFTVDTTAVPDEEINGLELYPNPITDVLNIESEEIISEIKVFNINGQKTQQFTPNKALVNIETNDWVPGYYIIKLTTKTQTGVYHIIKQ